MSRVADPRVCIACGRPSSGLKRCPFDRQLCSCCDDCRADCEMAGDIDQRVIEGSTDTGSFGQPI